MNKQNKDIVLTAVGAVLIVGSGMAGTYALGVTVVGGVLAALGLKELIL